MAVSFVEEPQCRFEKTAIITNSEHSPVASKATEIVGADDYKQPNECKHFTIRGYVAEVRKRDAENCWPFFLHNCASQKTANLCPPLPVANFRWWGCQNCVCQMTTGAAMSVQNHDVKNNNISLLGKDTETSQLDARKVWSKLPQISKENNLKEILKINDCFVNISRVGKKENECLRRDLIEEGSKKRNDVGKGNCVSNKCIAAYKRKRGEYRKSVGWKKSGGAYLKDSFSSALVKHKGNKLKKIGHSKMLSGDATSIRIKFAFRRSKEYKGPERKRKKKKTKNDVLKGHTRVDMVVLNDNVLVSDSARTLCLRARRQDKQSCGGSVDGLKYMGLTLDNHQIQNEVDNRHNKKIRKVRFLEDIIRSEKQNTTGNTIDRDAKTIEHAYQNNASKSDRGKCEIQNSLDEDEDEGDAITTSSMDRINHCVPRRDLRKSVKRKDRHENLYDEDEGPLLMHWLKNYSKKANAYEREASASHIDGDFPLSNISTDLFGRKDRDADVRDITVKAHKQKSAFNQKQTFSFEDSQLTSGVLIGETMRSKNLSSHDFNKKNSLIIEKTQHFSKEISHGAGGNAILHSNINKKPLNDRIEPCQTKDSSSTQKKAALEVWEKVSKKPRNIRTTDQEALDDIPMDIVELLARNQHDRHHVIAETDGIKYTCGLDTSLINRNNVSETEQWNLSCRKSLANNKGFDVWTTFPCNGEMGHESKACGCSIDATKKLQIDLNQHYSDSGSCNLDTTGNSHQLNLSCGRSNNMHSSQSILEDQMVSCKNLFRNPNHEQLRQINGSSFGSKSHFFNNRNGSVLGRDLKLFTHSGDYEKPRNPVGKHHRHWGFSPAANFCPADLYSNETISALNLLRLMDQAAWSGEPRHHFQSYSGFIKETDMRVNVQCSESQLEYGSREKEPCVCPLEVVNPSTCQPRNSCLLFRPLPRIGILGPLLQKEIFNFSNHSRIPTRSSHGFLKDDMNDKIEPPCLNPNILAWNSHNSLFRCNCSEKIVPDRDPDRVELNNKVDALLPHGFYKMEVCVVNRNPADFTVLDETNEYMMEIKELKRKSVPPADSFRGPVLGQKKQRVMKLDDLKAFAMG